MKLADPEKAIDKHININDKNVVFACLHFCSFAFLHFCVFVFLYFTYKPFADPVPPNTKQYQLILTKYQPVSSYTDPVPSSTTYDSSSSKAQFSQLNNFSFYDSIDESRTVYLV